MMSLNLFYNPVRIGFRTLSVSQRRKPLNKSEVGIKNRLAIFKEENRDMGKLAIDDQALDEMESELVSGAHLVEAHRKGVQKLKKKTELMITERKYFDRVKLPNLLTWSDKEQIRNLHRIEPDQWTFEKLSEHFPATPDIIKKVVESKWKITSQDRLLKHDKEVNKNWQLVRSGSIQLDPDLKKHISSFSPRENIELQSEDYKLIKAKAPKLVRSNEFTRIVADYRREERLLNDKTESTVKSIEAGDPPTRSEITENSMSPNKSNFVGSLNYKHDDTENNYSHVNTYRDKNDNKLITLDELRKSVNKKSSSSLTEYDKAFLNKPDSKVSPLVDVDSYETAPISSVEKNSIVKSAITKEINIPTEDTIPMRIKIPVDSPKGTLYKVKDVYYDTDGRFLYRVPGMK